MDLSHFQMWTTIGQIVLPFLLCVLPLERAFPRRPGVNSLAPRWRANALIAVAGVLVALLVGHVMTDTLTTLGGSIGVVSIAALPIPSVAKVIASLLIMDFLAYLLHVLARKVGVLWRQHQIHHSDNHFDASTGLRHQPLEGAINLCLLIVCYAALGLPLVVIAIYGVVFAAHAIVSHVQDPGIAPLTRPTLPLTSFPLQLPVVKNARLEDTCAWIGRDLANPGSGTRTRASNTCRGVRGCRRQPLPGKRARPTSPGAPNPPPVLAASSWRHRITESIL